MNPPAATAVVADQRIAPTGPLFAALDLGTNNCRLMVAARVGNGFRVLDSLSRIVRLGDGLHDSGILSEASMARAMLALHDCADRLGRRRIRAVRAIATEACRRARNGAEFLGRVQRETGLAFDVVSTREEAELAMEACAPLLAPLAASGERRAVLFDIGGGSTEISWVRLAGPGSQPQIIGTVSLPVGVVSLAGRGHRDFEAIVGDVAAALLEFEAVHRIGREVRRGGVVLLGTSGTVTTLAGVALELPRYRRPLVDGVILSAGDAAKAVALLRGLGPAGLAAHPCVGPERMDFVLPGCAIFAAIHRVWPAPRIVVADRGLRDGILLRLMRADSLPRHGRLAGPPAYAIHPA